MSGLARVKNAVKKRGEKRGAKNEKLKIAKTMLEEGLSAELIMRYTGLSKDAVAALQV